MTNWFVLGTKLVILEKILCISGGLDEEIEVVVAIISSNEKLSSLQKVQSLLIAHEGILEQKKLTNREYKPRCQICEKYEHTVKKCYFKFDANFTPAKQGSSNTRSQNANINTVNICNKNQNQRMQILAQQKLKTFMMIVGTQILVPLTM